MSAGNTSSRGFAGDSDLRSVCGLLWEILQELRERVQKGETHDLTRTITQMEVVNLPDLFSVTVTNDGPGNVEVRIPGSGSGAWLALQPPETRTFTAAKPIIKSIGVRPVGGATPVLRIAGWR